MPLRDHFQEPISRRWPWEGIQSAWANAIVIQLNEQVLPPDYQAIPMTHIGSRVASDAATVQLSEGEGQTEGNGAVAVWAPPKARLVALLDFTDRDTFEVQVRQGDEPRLVAAIELVSPANKDRPSSRRDFVVKCASYLQHDISVIVVDVVTPRRDNLHRELMHFLEMPDELIEAAPSPLYTVSYRASRRPDDLQQLELWPELLAVDAALPTMPLWIAEDRAVPVDLEESYESACRGLRIR